MQKAKEARTEAEILKHLVPLVENVIKCLIKNDVNAASEELTKEEYAFFAHYLKFDFYNKGENIYKIGEFDSKFYILMEGECSILTHIDINKI